MTLRYIEGWDWLEPTGAVQLDQVLKADSASIVADASPDLEFASREGRFGIGLSLRIYGGFNFGGWYPVYRKVLPSRVEGASVIGMAWKVLAQPGAVSGFTVYDSQTGSSVVGFYSDGEGIWRVHVANVVVGSSRPGLWFLNTWHYVQMKFTPGSTGSIQLKVDGEIVIDLTNVDITPGVLPAGKDWGYDCYQIDRLGARLGNIELFLDDMYFIDQLGVAPWNNYVGNVRVGTQKPDAAGDRTEMTAVGAATNWQAVTADYDVSPDDPTYVTTDLVGETDLYNVEMNVPAREIFGVQLKVFYRQTDAIQLFSQNVMKTNLTEYYGEMRGVAQTYVARDTIWQVNPNTGVAWTNTDLANIQIGGKLHSSD